MSNEQRIGIFFIVGLVLLFLAIELTLGVGFFRHRYTLYATFHDVQGLDTGADVRLAGLRAGRVQGMQIEGDQVRVEMAIDGKLEVKKDAVARLDFRALSGERFVALTLGTPTAPRAQPGDTLEGETPASFSDVVNQLSEVADTVSDLASGLNTNAERLLTNLSDLIEENRSVLGTTAQNLASITTKIDRGTGTLGLLVNDPTLYDRATSTLGNVEQSVADLGRVASNLADGQGTLGKLLTQDDGLYDQVRETMASLETTARNAEEITSNLRAGQGTVGKALTDDSLYNEAQDTLRTVNRATQAVEDQAPISILGTIATTLF